MRLDQLQLKAFGAFQDCVIDLSQGKEGLHLIYGPNEAGKSTTLRAITQLLYGIPARTDDDFRHSMKTLRIGATIRNAEETLSFLRRKGNKGTLRDADDKAPLDDDVLTPFLGGVDEESFTHLFGLSHAQLVAGGKTLVQGEGDVGQALFSAASGIGSLRKVLESLEEEAGELFKPSGSKPRINAQLSHYKALRKSVKEAQLLPKEWAAQAEALAEARQEREGVLTAIKDLTTERSRAERILKALPLVAQRLELLAELEGVADAVLLPDDFRERRISASQSLAAAREQHRIAEANLSRLQQELDALEVDESLLAQESRIEALHGRHEVMRKALDDKARELLPEHQQREEEVARILRTLKWDRPREELESLRPEPGRARRINELASSQQRIQQERTHTAAQQRKRGAEVTRYQAVCAGLADVPDSEGLQRVIQAARPLCSRAEEQRNRAEAIARLEDVIARDLGRLPGWSGSVEDLQALKVPPASTVERFRVQWESDEADARRLEEEERALEQERAEIAAQLDALQRAQEVPTEAALQTQRELRDAGWQLARSAWEAGTPPEKLTKTTLEPFRNRLAEHQVTEANLADAVEALTHHADELADRLRRESDRAAHLAQLESRRDGIAERMTAFERRKSKAEGARRTQQDAWHTLWEDLGLEARSPQEMAEWRADYGALLEKIAERAEAMVAQSVYEEAAGQMAAQLRSALEAVGVGAIPKEGGLLELVSLAEEAVTAARTKQQEHTQATAQLAEAERVLTDLAEEQARLEAEQTEWDTQWSELMGRMGARPDQSPTEATAKLELLDGLFRALDRVAALEGRIARIDEDYGAYLEEVEHLSSAANSAGVDAPLENLVPALFQALKLHRGRAVSQAGILKQQSEQAESLAMAEAAVERAEGELADLCALAQVADSAALEEAEERSAHRRQLLADQRAIESRILDSSPGQALDDFLAAVGAAEHDTLAARIETIEPELAELEGRRDRLSEVIGDQEGKLKQLDGRSEAAEHAAEAESLLASMADDARRYAQLKVAGFVLSEAIERYRAANQEPLLARASAIFSTLTLGSFAELRADVDDRGQQVLCGVRASNEALVQVGGMSEGSADQLYLALRLASLERHLEHHAPIPFVLDDILVNFDDARAAATLQVLGELSNCTQVIYFTHHQHLVDLAKDSVGKKQLFTHTLRA